MSQDTLYPLEFFLAATPVSQQASTNSKERWKKTVKETAQNRQRETDELGWLDERPTVSMLSAEHIAQRGDGRQVVNPPVLIDARVCRSTAT